MKNTVISLLMLFTSATAFGGFNEKLPVKWGKISPSEFSVVPSKADAAAPAIVLCDYGDIEVTNRTFYTRHTRIRILNEDGLRYASVEIPYQTRNRHDVFYALKAQTLVLENGKIVKYKVPADKIEDIKINDRWNKKKFTFPNAAPGVIVEFEYTIASLDFQKLNTWYFQREIPVIWSEVRFEVPSPYVYLVSFENNRQLAPDEEAVYGEKLQWLYNTGERQRHFQLIDNKYLLYNTNENRYKVWAMNNTKKKIIMKNLPGLAASSGAQPVSYHYPQVRFDLFESSGNLPRSFMPLLLTTYKDYDRQSEWSLMHNNSVYIGYVHYRLKTWSQYNKELLNDERFGQYLIKSPGVANLSDSLADKRYTELERVHAVYHYVRDKFKWNGQFSSAATQDFKEFMKTKTGSSAEMNLILVNLLRQNGIRSNPIMIRTADRGKPEKMYPVKDEFNHVIASAEIGGSTYLFDATSDSPELNRLNKADLGTEGWIVNNDNPGWLEIFSAEGKKDAIDELPIFRL